MAKVILFSGAGISAESGIKTFRDSDGLWENNRIEDVCTRGCLEKNRSATLKFYNQRRIELKDKTPNDAHIKIAQLKKKYPNEIAVITQNVDDLFERAGCQDLIHLHGFLREIRCMRRSCNYVEDIGYGTQDEKKRCPACNKTLRPNVVFFNEHAPKYKELNKALKGCQFLVVIGTSGVVIDINSMARGCKNSILNNFEPSMAIDDKLFSKVIYDKATVAIDDIIKDIEAFLQ
jgi:NAD-dependent deacetylase